MKETSERFTDTVENYQKYRPGYPKEILEVLVHDCHLNKNYIIADIGSGTGFLSKLFLDYGNTVYGLEPNQAMREAAENYLKTYPCFHSLTGFAEDTSFQDHSIDMITVGTAFHWFAVGKTKIEFQRILKPSGYVVLIWNVRDLEHSLMQDYEALITNYGTDYSESRASRFDKTALEGFFNRDEMKTCWFRNTQSFDWDGLTGRLLSTSYSLRPHQEGYEAMLAALRRLFDKYQKDGKVEFLYKTKLYYGRI